MIRIILLAVVCVLSVVTSASADTLYIGIDLKGPVQRWTTGGTFIDSFGQGGATGTAIDGTGNFWTVAPGFGNNTIKRYDVAGTELGSFVATVNGQFIEDMTYAGGSIWASTYEGWVHEVDDTTGATLGSFDAGGSFVGVTFDGTHLYTTNGFFGDDSIEKWTTGGVFVSSISTGFNGGAGLGYSFSTNSFWVGYAGSDVRQFDTSGNLLSSFNTGGNYFHDGLEVDSERAVPEPSLLALLATGLAVMLVRRRRSSTS